jgi:ATP-dependent helicase/nuclease subunit A
MGLSTPESNTGTDNDVSMDRVRTVAVVHGGGSKRSIYRFRRADITWRRAMLRTPQTWFDSPRTSAPRNLFWIGELGFRIPGRPQRLAQPDHTPLDPAPGRPDWAAGTEWGLDPFVLDDAGEAVADKHLLTPSEVPRARCHGMSRVIATAID